jgi:cob(I)alamin adenosyltransferase
MKIYTKTGDRGMTSMYGGGKVLKSDSVISVIGALDECNCSLGLAASFCSKEGHDYYLKNIHLIQNLLFDFGSVVSFLGSDREKKDLSQLSISSDFEKATAYLEESIDSMEQQLPSLTEFILPGGHQVAAQLHLCRGMCRRAERFFVVQEAIIQMFPQGLVWINRLSDYLFVLARHFNHFEKSEETTWNKNSLELALKSL